MAKLKIELTQKIEAPSMSRNDISFELKNSGIYKKPVYGYPSDDEPTDSAVSITESYSYGKGGNITIPLNQVDNFCAELLKFSREMKQIDSIK